MIKTKHNEKTALWYFGYTACNDCFIMASFSPLQTFECNRFGFRWFMVQCHRL